MKPLDSGVENRVAGTIRIMIISHSQALTAINLSHKTANAAESRATVGDGAGYHQLRRPKYFQLRGNNQFRLQVRNVSQPDSEVSKETDRNSLKSLDAQLASRATPSTKAPTNTLPPETKGIVHIHLL